MELKLTFNSDAESYEKYRTKYSKAMFNDLINYSKLNKQMKVIEVGIGTGQATQTILDTDCELTAIEIGDKLAEFVKNKFVKYKNLNVINQDFESVDLKNKSFDLIYSASAFHWIPLDFGMKKVLKLLKSTGVFAWIATTPVPSVDDEHIYNDIQKVYIKYSKYFGGHKVKRNLSSLSDGIERKLAERVEIFKEYSFVDVESGIYLGSRTFKAQEYVKMIATFSDHKVIPLDDRQTFFKEIEDVINRFGGEYTLTDRYLLVMGRKK